MKQWMVIAGLALTVAACNNEEKKTTDATDTKAVAAVQLPFTLEKPYRGWQMAANDDNTIAAMNCLKHFVDKDYSAMTALFGDSVEIRLDGFAGKMSGDSAGKFLAAQRPMYNDLTVTMYDYESVISADKKDEYVTLWYKQAWKDANGKADSVNIVDDCKMKNGKLIELDEKQQRFPAAN